MDGVAQEAEPLRSNTTSERILAVRGDQQLERADRLATEEPMEIQVRGAGQEAERVAVTMRTPGNDFELAVGFLFTEGLIHSRDEVESVRYCETELPEQRYNVVTVRLTHPFDAGHVPAELLRDVELRRLRQGVDRPHPAGVRAASRPDRPWPAR